MPEVAFVSYSSENTKYESYLRDFVAELRVEIHEKAPAGVKSPDDTLFFDSDNIETGEDWVKRIANSVSTCKVLVAFCSPHFKNSRFCGKELHIFLERVKTWQAKNGSKPARTIISVVWSKDEIPKALTKFQFKEAILPNEYQLNDLRTLCRFDEFGSKKKQFATALAKRICDALKQNLPQMSVIPHFDLIPSAFETPRVGARYGVAFVNLLQSVANPFAFDGLMAGVCGTLVPYRALELDHSFLLAVKRAKANREAIVIVADLTTLINPIFQNAVKKVDSAGGNQTALVIAGQPKDVDQQHITLRGAFAKSAGAFWEQRIVPTGEVGLRPALSEVVAKMRSRLVLEDPHQQAQDATTIEEAKAAGVPVERKPSLNVTEAPR